LTLRTRSDHLKDVGVQGSWSASSAYPAAAPRHYAAEQGMLKRAAGAPETRCAQTVRGVFPPLRLSIPKFDV